MVTKVNRRKSQERIDKALKAYGLAEDKADGWLRRLADSRLTVAWIAFFVSVGVFLWAVL